MKRFEITEILFGCLIFFLLARFSFAQDKKEQSAYHDYIVTLENMDHDKFTDILISELETYLTRYPNANDADQMQFKLATIYWDRDEKVPAFFAHMKILYTYPGSNIVTVSKDRLRSLLVREKKFKPLRAKVDTLINPTLRHIGHENTQYQFIEDMVDLNFDPIKEYIISACDDFLRVYPTSEHAAQVRFWFANFLDKEKKYERALAEYMKLTYLNSQSTLVVASKLKMADIYTKSLKMHKKAVLTLEEFLLEYPDDPQAPQALFQIAKINETKLKKHLEAINTYSDVAKKYPQSVEAVPSLFQAAKLYESKFKDYDQAIRVYTEIVRDFPNDLKAPYAYTEAARIYEKKLKDPMNAANVYYKVYANYPKSSIAAQSLFAAAEINENKLNDFEKAVMYYRFLVDNYPEHKLAVKAQKHIDKLSKKMAAEQ